MYGFSYEESGDETALNEQRYTFGEFKTFLKWMDKKYNVLLATGWGELYGVDLDDIYIYRRIPTKDTPNLVKSDEVSLEDLFKEFRASK